VSNALILWRGLADGNEHVTSRDHAPFAERAADSHPRVAVGVSALSSSLSATDAARIVECDATSLPSTPEVSPPTNGAPQGMVRRLISSQFLTQDGDLPWLNRPRRVLLALACVWVLNACDLSFTLLESTRRSFHELNPVAVHLIGEPMLVVAYKVALVVFGSSILLALSRHRLAELSTWFLVAAYAYVAVRWAVYFEHMLETLNDPAIDMTTLALGGG
jgi:hypothetical protein